MLEDDEFWLELMSMMKPWGRAGKFLCAQGRKAGCRQACLIRR